MSWGEIVIVIVAATRLLRQAGTKYSVVKEHLDDGAVACPGRGSFAASFDIAEIASIGNARMVDNSSTRFVCL